MERKNEAIKKIVKERYAGVALQNTSCGCANSCCGGAGKAKEISKTVGYNDDEMNSVPENSNLGLGCGNPVAIASLKAGDIVLDLGSGAGFDVFLSARKVGEAGRVIGVDMTPEMIKKARDNARKGNFNNVEFRLGEIEQLPVEDGSIDVIISNCVINLSCEKQKVFKEAFRVLKPGGRIMISDLVLTKDLPAIIKESAEAYVGCLAGAIMKDEYLGYIKNAGFCNVEIAGKSDYSIETMVDDVASRAVKNDPGVRENGLQGIKDSVMSIKVSAVKPLSAKGARS